VSRKSPQYTLLAVEKRPHG